MAQLIDGKAISQQIKDELKAEVEALKNDGTDICLAVIQVGDDPASSVYVRNKKRACAFIGVESRAYELPEDTTEEQLVELVKEELLERTNYECVFFTAGGYSNYGVPMFQECCHYFSSYD